jgi:hypothetical protein
LVDIAYFPVRVEVLDTVTHSPDVRRWSDTRPAAGYMVPDTDKVDTLRNTADTTICAVTTTFVEPTSDPSTYATTAPDDLATK